MIAVGLWSTNAFAAGVALVELNVAQLLLVQYGCAALALLGWHSLGPRAVTHRVPRIRVRETAAGVVGLTGTIFLQYLAFATAPLVAANVIAYGWPLFAAGWFAMTIRRRGATVTVLLAAVGFCGVALIFGGQGVQGDAGATLGYLAALGSAACMAFFTVAAGRMRATAGPLLLPATVIGAVAVGMWELAQRTPWPAPGAWLVAAYIGIGPMAVGYALWGYAMSSRGAERLAPIGFATPVLSTMVLIASGRPATPLTMVGAALVLACSVAVLMGDHRRQRAENAVPATERCGASRT